MMDLTLILALLLGALGDEIPAAGLQGKPAAPAASAQDPDRPLVSAAEIKLLRDSNIFAPRTAKRRPPPTPPKGETSRRPSAPAQPKPPVVTGIFYDAKAQAYLVVVEDRNEASLKQFKEPKFLKSGDEVNGLTIGPVTAEKAVFLKGEISKELRVGESLPGSDGKPVSATPSTEDPEAEFAAPETPEKVEIKPLDTEEKNKVLENMKKLRGKKNRPSQDE